MLPGMTRPFSANLGTICAHLLCVCLSEVQFNSSRVADALIGYCHEKECNRNNSGRKGCLVLSRCLLADY